MMNPVLDGSGKPEVPVSMARVTGRCPQDHWVTGLTVRKERWALDTDWGVVSLQIMVRA